MKKREEQEEEEDIEIVRAVAQAWHAHSGNPRPTKELEAHRSHFRQRPTRFKIEAMIKKSEEASSNWDFRKSLWDSYEIATVSKKLEAGLSLDHPLTGEHEFSKVNKRRRESKNSLRNLFSRTSSRRFDVDILRDLGFED